MERYSVSEEAEMGGAGELGNIYCFSGQAYPGDSGGPIVTKRNGCVIGILRSAIGSEGGIQQSFMKPICCF